MVERSDTTGIVSEEKLLAPRQGCKTFYCVVVRWCRRSRSSTTGYWLRCLRDRFDLKVSFVAAKSIFRMIRLARIDISAQLSDV